jgi:hypothetical protein
VSTLADPRLTEWRDESGPNPGTWGRVWRRHWMVGWKKRPPIRAAVVFDYTPSKREADKHPVMWCTSPYNAPDISRDVDGRAYSIDEGKAEADKALAKFLLEMP